ncbi:alpha/beta hydrolase family protein [Rhizoctonia solani AG-3 Rhs1AP]|uniref:Alpha/beta hydrolase family protein n=1 Tax=Rhizoctonia solani AG-3 Rhs1AP TaxID=1086054 RepID=X8J3A7_9AGAM|nr:alpha/beta hydrolase family protein [Rhizoctonia solani AG-3 Rhs1AP]
MARSYSEKIKLVWSAPPEHILPPHHPNDPKLPSPPIGTHRHYLSTSAGHLEVLYALPGRATLDSPAEESWKAPVLFVHGGFGSANCYSNFLPWFAEREYPVYSLSLRGHGQSWYPSYRALYFTPKHVLADDVATALRFIRKQHPSAGPTTLVGHSSGGGLCQHVIDSGKGEGVGKLVVLAGIPSFGGWRVYLNWFMLDPWFPIRVLWDLYHPRSPLSSTRLVHRAFFSPTYSIEKVRTFEAEMSPYESMTWPSGMMFPFISRKRLLTNLIAYNTHAPLLTIGGAQDKLVSVPIMRRLAYLYADTSVRTHAGAATAEKKLGCKDVSGLQDGLTSGVNRTSEEKEKERGKVWFAKIEEPGAGHNLMRDDGWERCVRVIEAFVNE